MTRNLLLKFMTVISVTASGQPFKTEDQNLKGWTTETKIVYADFKGNPTEQLKRLNEEAGLQASAQMRLKSILDVPKKEKGQRATFRESSRCSIFYKDHLRDND